MAKSHAHADVLVQICGHLVEEQSYRPVRRGVCGFGCEVEEDVGAVRRMHDFGVELNPVEFARLVGDGGERGRPALLRWPLSPSAAARYAAEAYLYGVRCCRKPVIYAEFQKHFLIDKNCGKW